MLRGAGYELVTPGAPVPSHGAVGAPYAHVTAPLRRLADRHANEVVLAACAGVAPPAWAVAALPDLVTVMPRANQHSSAVNRACVDAVEVVLLAGHEGETFPARSSTGTAAGVVVMLTDVPIVATAPGSGELGDVGDGQARDTGCGRPDVDVRAAASLNRSAASIGRAEPQEPAAERDRAQGEPAPAQRETAEHVGQPVHAEQHP